MGLEATELRGLLERVEAHGGPLRVAPLRDNDYVFVDGWRHCTVDEAVKEDHHAPMVLVGVLKRDLIERGFNLSIAHEQNVEPAPWQVVVTYPLEVPIDPPPYYGTYGDSELEALLRAWLAAADTEGWTP